MLSGPGASLMESHRNGIPLITSLTFLSRFCSSTRTDLGAELPSPQVGQFKLPSRRRSAAPTCCLKTEPRWFPPRARQRIVGTTFHLIDNAAARYGPRSQVASAWSTGRMILVVVIMLGLYVLLTTS